MNNKQLDEDERDKRLYEEAKIIEKVWIDINVSMNRKLKDKSNC